MPYPSTNNVYDCYALPKAFLCPECHAFLEVYIEQHSLREKILPEEVEVECTAETGLEEPLHNHNLPEWKKVEDFAVAWVCQYLRINKHCMIEEIKP